MLLKLSTVTHNHWINDELDAQARLGYLLNLF